MGPVRQIRRPQLVLDTGDPAVGGAGLGDARHPAHRAGSGGGLPARRPGPAYRDRQNVPRQQYPAGQAAGQQNPDGLPLQDPQGRRV
ncbi:protein of unknown function [Xenorhabdus doucetiae]|uniref:Uncharacterized protein n=1 Tax=Xenorhabdus doucetiae TaxID=351671 RepID=A0A068QWT2_9GAMM|nr:protein of unknown function [Xenorhabdus doucetiae]